MLKVKRKMQLEYVDHENLKQKYLKKNKNFRDVRESIHGKLLTEIGPIKFNFGIFILSNSRYTF